jgi:hypothetical protein
MVGIERLDLVHEAAQAVVLVAGGLRRPCSSPTCWADRGPTRSRTRAFLVVAAAAGGGRAGALASMFLPAR